MSSDEQNYEIHLSLSKTPPIISLICKIKCIINSNIKMIKERTSKMSCTFWLLIFCLTLTNTNSFAQDLEDGFISEQVLDALEDPASFAFSPDGRLFYGERITGNLRTANWDPVSNTYIKSNIIFHHFDVPPVRHRSSGLRGFVFDPSFLTNGYIYAFYMKDNPRHNRVVRIQMDPSNPDKSLGTETLIMDLPFNATSSSGSHNGGDMVIGADGKLYFTTGDGWNGGDDVQSLSTFTGKVMRVNLDGSIPSDNPFFTTASDDYRAIYALGLRNPYSVSNLSETQNIYINDAVGNQKASVFKLSSASNYGHDGYNGIGIDSPLWANLSVNGSSVITGGLWYPSNGNWPIDYHGNYFAAFWGSNSSNAPGAITRASSETDISTFTFYENVIDGGQLKPVMLKLGMDHNLYFLMTDYETGVGKIYRISYNLGSTIAPPYFSIPAGQYDDPIQLSILHDSTNYNIYYSLDGSIPDENSLLFQNSIDIDSATLVKAIAEDNSSGFSQVINGQYTIGAIPNIAPIANAGPDLFGEVNQTITLNGSDSYDPDGSVLELQEHWEQIAGLPLILQDADETVANFTPSITGIYAFRIIVEDIYGLKDTNETVITVLPQINDYLDHLIARWSFEEGDSDVAEDTSPNSNTATIEGASWNDEVIDEGKFSMRFSEQESLVDIGNLDISGNQVSFSFWMKLNSYDQSDARFISKASGQYDDDHFWMVSTLNDSRLRFRLKTNGVTNTLSTVVNTLGLNEWIFITATYDNNYMRLYKNATMIDSLAATGNLSTDPLVNAVIGNQPLSATGGLRPLDGWIDEMRIYSVSLTQQNIEKIFQARFSDLCLQNLLIPNVITSLSVYKADLNIISDALIPNDKEIVFTSNNTIVLDPGFIIELGATFEAKMKGCAN